MSKTDRIGTTVASIIALMMMSLIYAIHRSDQDSEMRIARSKAWRESSVPHGEVEYQVIPKDEKSGSTDMEFGWLKWNGHEFLVVSTGNAITTSELH